ncbi:hypothetical protein [Labilithrix luteola]|uniref:hypothetical protein n=1 Tax=Labilithrix luteola TaxID=1391654 RepID=UPI0011BAB8C3|nr:hypothetical protein [Labilithrix luteola]
MRKVRWTIGGLACVAAGTLLGCKHQSLEDAETQKDVRWLADQGTPEAITALGRLADTTPAAVTALEARASTDLNVYIAAWQAVTRKAAWGTTMFRSALGDPSRADLAATAMPRRDVLLAPFAGDIENAVTRLAAGRAGGVLAGLLASIGPQAHAAVERRLVDPKTRGAMCDGIGMPDASGDAKSLLLAVAPDARDHATCVNDVIAMAGTEDVVLDWLGTGAEPGLVSATAKSTLACPRLGVIWQKALTTRPEATFAALTVPLQASISRCSRELDSILADVLAKAPRARGCIVQAIDPYGGELADMKNTCTVIKQGWARGETARTRERIGEALSHGCRFAK